MAQCSDPNRPQQEPAEQAESGDAGIVDSHARPDTPTTGNAAKTDSDLEVDGACR